MLSLIHIYDFLKDYAFTRKIDRANLNEVLAELEEAARPFATIEEWFRHIEEYTLSLIHIFSNT